jgi:hypothetical protein
MKQYSASSLGRDFGFAVVLAAMLVVGASALVMVAKDRSPAGASVGVPHVGERATIEVVNVLPYRIEVIGVRPNETAQGDAREFPANRRQPG